MTKKSTSERKTTTKKLQCGCLKHYGAIKLENETPAMRRKRIAQEKMHKLRFETLVHCKYCRKRYKGTHARDKCHRKHEKDNQRKRVCTSCGTDHS